MDDHSIPVVKYSLVKRLILPYFAESYKLYVLSFMSKTYNFQLKTYNLLLVTSF